MRLVGGVPRFAGLTAVSGEWRLDLGALRDAVSQRTRTIFINNASLGMRERTITIGSVSQEQRMIGWRVGWVVAPGGLAHRVATVHTYNGLVASGFCQLGALAALTAADDGLLAAVQEWQRRRDEMLQQLDGLPVTRPAGAWSMLLESRSLGVEPSALSARLLRQKVAATPMTGWGDEIAARYLRLVFSNEPVHRLANLGERVRRALASAG